MNTNNQPLQRRKSFRVLFYSLLFLVLLNMTTIFSMLPQRNYFVSGNSSGNFSNIAKWVDVRFLVRELQQKLWVLSEDELKQFVFHYGNTSVRTFGKPFIDCKTLFIGIHSAPNNTDRRNGIRETYLVNTTDEVCHRFILGNPTKELYEENEIYKDLVFIDQLERYRAMESILSFKTAAIMNIASRNKVQPKWILKVDDDSFVNMPHLMKKLNNLSESNYYGKCHTGDQPLRDKQSIWYISEELWPSDNYPPFCFGAGYILPLRAAICGAKVIANQSFVYFPLEDVATGIIMEKCNITAQNLHGIDNDYRHYYGNLISHYVKTSSGMKKLWGDETCLAINKNFAKCGIEGNKPSKRRKTNWNRGRRNRNIGFLQGI